MNATDREARAENLFLFVQNDHAAYDSICHYVRMMRATLDRCAVQLSKERAKWHDDPEAEDHAEFHAPAIEQFPLDMRDRVAVELFTHYMSEVSR